MQIGVPLAAGSDAQMKDSLSHPSGSRIDFRQQRMAETVLRIERQSPQQTAFPAVGLSLCFQQKTGVFPVCAAVIVTPFHYLENGLLLLYSPIHFYQDVRYYQLALSVSRAFLERLSHCPLGVPNSTSPF